MLTMRACSRQSAGKEARVMDAEGIRDTYAAAETVGDAEITVHKIDGTEEEVKVRQLPVRLLEDWGRLQSQEGELVELLCGKQNGNAIWNIENERAVETRLLALLRQSPFDQIEFIEKRLIQTREAIAKHESAAHWSDSLTDESIFAIIDLGNQLNAKRFTAWAGRMSKSVNEATMPIIELLVDKLKQRSPLPSSDQST
jgi:hypothetical protein